MSNIFRNVTTCAEISTTFFLFKYTLEILCRSMVLTKIFTEDIHFFFLKMKNSIKYIKFINS